MSSKAFVKDLEVASDSESEYEQEMMTQKPGMSTGAKVGIAVAGVVLVGGAAFAVSNMVGGSKKTDVVDPATQELTVDSKVMTQDGKTVSATETQDGEDVTVDERSRMQKARDMTAAATSATGSALSGAVSATGAKAGSAYRGTMAAMKENPKKTVAAVAGTVAAGGVAAAVATGNMPDMPAMPESLTKLPADVKAAFVDGWLYVRNSETGQWMAQMPRDVFKGVQKMICKTSGKEDGFCFVEPEKMDPGMWDSFLRLIRIR